MTAADYGLQTPKGADLISQGDDAITHNAERTAELIDQMGFQRSALHSTQHLDSLSHSGAYLSVGQFTVGRGYPKNGNGTVNIVAVSPLSTHGVMVANVIESAGARVFMRRRYAGVWRDWYPIDGNHGRLEPGKSVDDLTDPADSGIRFVRGADNDGLPEGFVAGWLWGDINTDLGATNAIQVLIERYAGRVFMRGMTGGEYLPWVEQPSGADMDALRSQVSDLESAIDSITVGGGGPGANAGAAQVAIRERFIQARGGTIGTGGLGAVALRWDHGPDNAIATGLPEAMRSRGLPWGWAHYSRQQTVAGHSTPWADIEQIALSHGAEVWSHSATHEDATDTTGYVREIKTSREELRAAMPSQQVDGFVTPGVGGTNYGGFVATTRPEQLYETEAGRIALENYAVMTGQMGGYVHPLAGQLSHCRRQRTVDSMTTQEVIDLIGIAQDTRSGVALMLHPEWAGATVRAKYMEVLDHIVQERDAGRLFVASLSGWQLLDHRSDYRHDLALNSEFASGLNQWSGSGFTAGDGMVSGAGELTQTINLSYSEGWAFARGATRESLIEVRAQNGAGITLERNGAVVGEWEISAGDSAWKILRRSTYIAANATTDTTTLTVSGDADVRAVKLLAV